MENVSFRQVRKRRSVSEKRLIVEQALEPGASVARVARAHGLNANVVFHWRRLYREGKLGVLPAQAMKLLPVSIAEYEVVERHPDEVVRPSCGRYTLSFLAKFGSAWKVRPIRARFAQLLESLRS